MKYKSTMAGMLLLEWVISIALASLLVVVISQAMVQGLSKSTHPQLRLQALLLAEAELESILATDFYDADTGTICPPAEPQRADYDNICDFHAPTFSAPVNSVGGPLDGLSNYQVSVSVDASGTVEVNGIAGLSAGGLPVWLKITVSVKVDPDINISLTAFQSSPLLSQ